MSPARSIYCTITGIFGALAMALCLVLCAGARADDPPRTTNLKAPTPQPPVKFTTHPGKMVEGMTLRATLARSVVRPGDPVLLRLSLKNNAPKVRGFVEIVPEEVYTLRIVDPSGHVTVVPSKPLSVRFITKWVSLRKGESTQVDYRVDAVFAFSQDGRYAITAGTKWLTLRGDKVVDLISNTVVLKVQSAAAPARH